MAINFGGGGFSVGGGGFNFAPGPGLTRGGGQTQPQFNWTDLIKSGTDTTQRLIIEKSQRDTLQRQVEAANAAAELARQQQEILRLSQQQPGGPGIGETPAKEGDTFSLSSLFKDIDTNTLLLIGGGILVLYFLMSGGRR